jgi:hypothetical protein
MDYGMTVLKKTAQPTPTLHDKLAHSQPAAPHFPFLFLFNAGCSLQLADAPACLLLLPLTAAHRHWRKGQPNPPLPRRRSPPLPQGPSVDLVSTGRAHALEGSTAPASSSRLHRGKCRRPGRPDPASWPSREPPRAAQGRSLADPWPPRLPYLSGSLSRCRLPPSPRQAA